MATSVVASLVNAAASVATHVVSSASDTASIVGSAEKSAAPTASVAAPSGSTTAPVVQTAAAPAAPIVVVRQFEQLKTYNCSTSHRSFHSYFEGYSKTYGWTTKAEKAQHLALALEQPAAEVLRTKESESPCELIWLVLVRRFGSW